MNIRFKNIKKFQDGGALAPEAEAPMEQAPVQPEAAPAEQGGGDPMEMLMQLAQGAAQALQTQDANMAFQVCEGLVQFIQMAQGGGEPAPEESAPVYKRGGLLVRRIKK